MFERFATRSYELERLDTGEYTPAEYRRWQREMWFIHRMFGELRALRRTLFRDIEADGDVPVSVLDVGAGSGELLRTLAKWTAGRKTFLVGAELNAEATRTIKSDRLAAIQCDALRLPFDDDSFDYVFCSLFLHHLGDEDAARLLKEMSRVARKRIYAIDLNRQPIAYYLYKALGRVLLQRFTLEDGALSILRSFSPVEMVEIANAAGLADIKVEKSRVNRLILSGRKIS
ncbi:MAG TPA: methyltransferase domain-containing protein [Pyrinomonadaceae bacterium]|nr:methyltransferase domain-containing protein [Pyrinomonadaceae bacterium]